MFRSRLKNTTVERVVTGLPGEISRQRVGPNPSVAIRIRVKIHRYRHTALVQRKRRVHAYDSLAARGP